MQTQEAFTTRKSVSVFASPLLLAGLLLILLSGCMSQATRARYERDRAWRMLGPDERATFITQSCGETDPNPQAYDFTSCTRNDPKLPPGPRRCTTMRLAPAMSQQQLSQDTTSTVTATCRTLSDTARRGGTTHQAWCASTVPGLLPQGLTIDQATERAGTCYAATLRREGDAADARKAKCCEARERLGSNGVWACLNDELDRLDLTHATDACAAALGGVQPYSAVLWCGICAAPETFLSQVTIEMKETRETANVLKALRASGVYGRIVEQWRQQGFTLAPPYSLTTNARSGGEHLEITARRGENTYTAHLDYKDPQALPFVRAYREAPAQETRR